MDLIKITHDKEKAKSILKMVSLIEERIKTEGRAKMAALIAADYYEIVKELITALLLVDGYKTLSHKDLIDYLQEKYPEFSDYEISVLDDLRVLRNRIAYEGFFVENSYLNRNEALLKNARFIYRGHIPYIGEIYGTSNDKHFGECKSNLKYCKGQI